jgi:heme/copper-type cytochrome/quinol oxidase subunit 2
LLSVLWIVAIILAHVIAVAIAVVVAFSSFDSSGFDPDNWRSESLTLVAVVSAVPTIMIMALVLLHVKRQNDHYSREARLRSAIMNLTRTAA